MAKIIAFLLIIIYKLSVDYLREFIGLKYGSVEFAEELAILEKRLHNGGILAKGDYLDVFQGEVSELIENGILPGEKSEEELDCEETAWQKGFTKKTSDESSLIFEEAEISPLYDYKTALFDSAIHEMHETGAIYNPKTQKVDEKGEVTDLPPVVEVPQKKKNESYRSEFPLDRAVVFRRASDGEILYVMRSVPKTIKVQMEKKTWADKLKPEYNEYEEYHIIPRYSGVTSESMPFTKEMMYYLIITLERFIGQCKMLPNFRDISPASTEELNIYIDNLRKNFIARHDQDIKLSPEIFDTYKKITRLMAEIVYLRVSPLYDYEDRNSSTEGLFGTKVIKNAFENDSEIPKVLTNPNQVLEICLQMGVKAISAIIIDFQSYENSDPSRSRYIEEYDNHQMMEISKPKQKPEKNPIFQNALGKLFVDINKVYKALEDSVYNPVDGTDRRYLLKSNEALSFKEMYREALGDLYKIVMCCAKKTPKVRANWINMMFFGNRIKKIGDCMHSIDEIESYFFKSKDLDRDELVELGAAMFRAARITVGTSASNREEFANASSEYSYFRARLGDKVKEYENNNKTMDWETARILEVILKKMDGLVSSKRPSEYGVSAVEEAIESYRFTGLVGLKCKLQNLVANIIHGKKDPVYMHR